MAVPEGWATISIDDACTFVGRGQAPAYVERGAGVYAVSQKCVRNGKVTTEAARPHDASKPVKPSAVLRTGDVCINSTGTGTAGRVGLWCDRRDATYFVDTHVTIARGRPDAVVPKFLAEWLGSVAVQKQMADECFSGSTNQIELNRSAFGALEVPIPPLPEQRKIAAILSSVDETIEKTEAVIEQLQVVKKAMMEELLTRGMPGRHTRFKETEIGEVPEGWEVVPLGNVVDIASGAAFPRELQGSKDGAYPFFKVSDMNRLGNERDLVEAENFVDGDVVKLVGGRLCPPGAVVFPKVGGALLTNKRRRIVRPSLFDNNVMGIVPRSLDGQFLYQWSLGLDFSRIVQPGALPSINGGQVKEIPIAVPPRSEQLEIADRLERVDARARAELAAVSAVRALKSSLSAALLSGDLRVTDDEASP